MERIAVVMPCLNDTLSLQKLIPKLKECHRHTKELSVWVVDDGSFPELGGFETHGLTMHIVRLRTNVGHQRAIFCGLVAVSQSGLDYDKVVVMDSDGEDDPQSIMKLAEQLSGERPFVFARRRRRSEGLFFRMGYKIYLWLFKSLLGFDLRFGNFSCFRYEVLPRLISNNDMWNHYAAAVVSSRLPFGYVDVDRAHRLDGTSKMNVLSLVRHGLSAISVFQDRMLLRIGSVVGVLFGLIFMVGVFVVVQKLLTGEAILGWASTMISILFVGVLNLFSLVFMLLIGVLGGRRAELSNPVERARSIIESVGTEPRA